MVVKVCVMLEPELFDAPLTPDCATVQAKVVPATLLVKTTAVAPPEQILCEEGVAVADGSGLTVTVTVTGVPAQPPAVGVIVYTAVPFTLLVALSVCAMVAPEDAEAPVTLVCVTVQAKVVPPVPLDNAMEVGLPEQSVCVAGVAVIDGAGFTVMDAVIDGPGHPPTLGVMV